jgi:hypothetical protein
LLAGMLLLYCFTASVVIWRVVECYCLQLQAELADLIKHSLTIIGCTFELPLFIIPMRSQRPTKYCPQVLTTVFSRDWLKSDYLRSQFPFVILDFDPVSSHSKKHSLCIVSCPSITRCCDLSWSSL